MRAHTTLNAHIPYLPQLFPQCQTADHIAAMKAAADLLPPPNTCTAPAKVAALFMLAESHSPQPPKHTADNIYSRTI
jgi:hypothetical protein